MPDPFTRHSAHSSAAARADAWWSGGHGRGGEPGREREREEKGREKREKEREREKERKRERHKERNREIREGGGAMLTASNLRMNADSSAPRILRQAREGACGVSVYRVYSVGSKA